MDPRAASLLRLFVDKLGGEVQVAHRRGAGRSERWDVVTETHEVVVNVLPEPGVVELDRHGQPVRLHFAEAELLALLDGAGASGAAAWGEPLADEEAAARFLLIHLDESIATQQADPSGWWEYEDRHFVPLPPWEAFARRRQHR